MRDRTITTITDAIRIISSWVERYDVQPSDDQIKSAAAALVEHIGGYGEDLTSELAETFDLDAALES